MTSLLTAPRRLLTQTSYRDIVLTTHFLSDLVSSVSLPLLPSAALQSHQPLSFWTIPLLSSALAVLLSQLCGTLGLQALCRSSSLINGSRLNVPPRTHLLASVTTKSPWSPLSAVPLHHIDQFMFFNAFVCLFPWNEAPIGEAGALSSLFPTASAPDAHSTNE